MVLHWLLSPSRLLFVVEGYQVRAADPWRVTQVSCKEAIADPSRAGELTALGRDAGGY